ncbi:MAG: alanine--tRNA ligase [Candidatus Kapabacteria bacterium]|nr:alanine--tRNA ligase [Candidatus Kapabacteria bacterium]
MMTSREIRNSFLEFFQNKDHRVVPSMPVVPHGDPTLLFANAGMNQFKDVFLGVGKRDYTRAADTQKCIRVSGKHNDLEEVGADTYHHTMFEMLGNWSFGDYYKKEAIAWAWELLTKVWKLDVERLHATVYTSDDEAYELWKKYLPESRIHRCGDKDNFWEMGETGPCGPCSEIHYDRTPDKTGGNLVNAGVPEVIEIWNLVFIQFNRKQDGTLENLAHKHVDTGMGFERICSVIQGVNSNYDTDVFKPLLDKIVELSGKTYSSELHDATGIAMRVIADHVRTLSFAIADGALPGNEGRSYVLRRILRRASKYSKNLGFTEPMLYKLVATLRDTMGDIFPELIEHYDMIVKVIKSEEENFLQTLEKGLSIFDKIVDKLKSDGKTIVSGDDVFLLYDTFGFPIDLTALIAKEKGVELDTERFNVLMQEQKNRSRSARKINIQEVEIPVIDATTEFSGYNQSECDAKVLYVEDNRIVLDKTPLYVESGGQVSDKGTIEIAGNTYHVIESKKVSNTIIHFCEEPIEAKVGDVVRVKIDLPYHNAVARNHTATHLLHEALRTVLGGHIKQAGSSVTAEALRFDFNHYEKVTPEEIEKVEKIANQKIAEAINVKTDELTFEQAQNNPKIKMFFGDKYGDVVRSVTIDPNFSIELCGGTHVKNTSDIGIVKITSESSIAAGVRRIEAVTGTVVMNYIAERNALISEQKTQIEELNSTIHALGKDISKLKQNIVTASFDNWIANAEACDEKNLIVQTIETDDKDMTLNVAEKLRDVVAKNAIILIAAVLDGKVSLTCAVTDDLKAKYPAGKLVGLVAKQLGGGGGGKPHIASAGGKEIAKLPEVMNNFANIVREYAK